MIIRMELKETLYDILVERGSLARAGQLLNLERKVLIVTDDGVPPRYAKTLAAQCKEPFLITVRHGEESKAFSVMETLLGEMLEHGFTRGDCVCAVGGGVVGDLSGFAASCYMRGIDFYNLPTTVLSQVDSSIGGKTAVNFGGVKNLAGAFHQPKGVLIDPDTLDTLSPRLVSNGLAEALKTGVIGDEALFSLFEKEDPLLHMEDVICSSLLVKKRVVEMDEKDLGRRMILNFGHTIGHGIESVTGLLHGECVALGMLPMCSQALRERLLPIYRKLALPTQVQADPEEVCRAVMHDKKMGSGAIRIVLSDAPGSCRMLSAAPETLMERIRLVVKP